MLRAGTTLFVGLHTLLLSLCNFVPGAAMLPALRLPYLSDEGVYDLRVKLDPRLSAGSFKVAPVPWGA